MVRSSGIKQCRNNASSMFRTTSKLIGNHLDVFLLLGSSVQTTCLCNRTPGSDFRWDMCSFTSALLPFFMFSNMDIFVICASFCFFSFAGDSVGIWGSEGQYQTGIANPMQYPLSSWVAAWLGCRTVWSVLQVGTGLSERPVIHNVDGPVSAIHHSSPMLLIAETLS